MGYTLNKKDLVDILHECIVGDLIDDDDQYMEFVVGIAAIVSQHFGGDIKVETNPDHQDEKLLFIERNSQCPAEEGGTIYDKYDPDSDAAEQTREFEKNCQIQRNNA